MNQQNMILHRDLEHVDQAVSRKRKREASYEDVGQINADADGDDNQGYYEDKHRTQNYLRRQSCDKVGNQNGSGDTLDFDMNSLKRTCQIEEEDDGLNGYEGRIRETKIEDIQKQKSNEKEEKYERQESYDRNQQFPLHPINETQRHYLEGNTANQSYNLNGNQNSSIGPFQQDLNYQQNNKNILLGSNNRNNQNLECFEASNVNVISENSDRIIVKAQERKQLKIIRHIGKSQINGFRLFQQLSENKRFCLFNDCVVDVSLFEDNNNQENNLLSQAIMQFKDTVCVIKANNGDIIQVNLSHISAPIVEYSQVIYLLKSLPSTSAQQLVQLIQQFQRKTQKYVDYIYQLASRPANELQQLEVIFQSRNIAAQAQAKMRLEHVPRNKFALTIQYHFDFKTKSLRLFSYGFSRKLLDIMGVSLIEAQSVFLRNGPLDIILRKDKTFSLLLCTIQLADHPKTDLIDHLTARCFIYTLDSLKIEAKVTMRVFNLTNRFDMLHHLQFPFCDDTFCEILYDIDAKNLEKLAKVRKEKNVFQQFDMQEIIEGDFQYEMEVNSFLAKYYSSGISSCKKVKKTQESICSQTQQQQQKSNQRMEIKLDNSSLSTSVQVQHSKLINVLTQNYVIVNNNLQYQEHIS